MKRKLIISLISLTSFCASAAMTLNDCLIYARDHAHTNRLQMLSTEKAKADQRISASSLMPSLSLSGSGNISFGRNIDPETNTYDNKQTLSTGYGLYLSIPLFDGLVSVNSLKASQVARLRSVQAAQVEQDLISLEVIKAFYNVDYCKAMVGQMQIQLQRDSTDLCATMRGEELGVKSGADVAEMKAVVATDRYELSNQRNLLAKAYLQLRGAMGMELSEEPLELEHDPSDEFLPGLSDSKHPRIAEAELALKESEYNLRAEKGGFFPKISLTGGVTSSYYKLMGSNLSAPGFGKQFKDNIGEYIALSISIPLFDGLANVNRVKRAKIEVEESRTRLDRTIYEIERATTEAGLDLKAAADELEAAQQRVEAEQLAYNAVRRKYELGNSSVIDLYTSSAKLATAIANLEGKRIQKIISGITLSYYLGAKLIKE